MQFPHQFNPRRVDRATKQAGFSLIELMTAVAIVGILSAVALPAYTDYVVRGKIPDATSILSAKQVRLEQYFQDHRTYVGASDCAADDSSSQYFSFSCSDESSEAYVLKAVGKASMAGFIYSVDQLGAKQTVAVPVGWMTASTCWVTRKGGVC